MAKRKMSENSLKNLEKGGRRPKYDKSYCEKIIKFFNIEPTKEKTKTFYDKNGEEHTIYEEVANSLPTFEGFAVSIGTHRNTLLEWIKKYPEFADAYKKAKDYQKNMLIDLGMRGYYNPTFTIFVAKNITDMKDKVEQDLSVSASLTTVDFGGEE